jgi:hypothetical protein
MHEVFYHSTVQKIWRQYVKTVKNLWGFKVDGIRIFVKCPQVQDVGVAFGRTVF